MVQKEGTHLKSLLAEFVSKHEDWETLIMECPYSLVAHKDRNLAIFRYRQGFTDMSQDICKEARGIIIDLSKNQPVCWPFNKFFNLGEAYADEIDWSTARVLEKLDGSLIKIWWSERGNAWAISTNNCINAFETHLFEPLSGDGHLTYGSLVKGIIDSYDFNLFERLKKGFTYMFELVSRRTAIVVDYGEDKLYHIGTRNNETGEEVEADIGVPKPASFHFGSLQEVVEAASAQGPEMEGYVVVDAFYKRVKIKTSWYLDMFAKKRNYGPNQEALLRMVLDESLDDFMRVFPRYAEICADIQVRYGNLVKQVEEAVKELGDGARELPRKEMAERILGKPIQGILFEWLSGKFELEGVDVYLRGLRPSYLLKALFRDKPEDVG
jgi:hypothetical protein